MIFKKKKEKRKLVIPYNPRTYPTVEVYFLSPKLIVDEASAKMQERMKFIYTMILNIVRAVGWDPSVIVKKKFIETPGEPHYVPCVFVNGVLFATYYTFDPDKFYEAMRKMKEMHDRYFRELLKNADKGYILMPNDWFIYTRDPALVWDLVSSQDAIIAEELGISVDSFEVIRADECLLKSLTKLCVPISRIAFAREVKYNIYVSPDPRQIEI